MLRVGRLEDVMREGKSVRRFRIKLAATGFALAGWLGARPGVSTVAAEAAGAEFAFAGGDVELAEFVGALVTAGAPVCGVEELTETLEGLYSRVSSGEVM